MFKELHRKLELIFDELMDAKSLVRDVWVDEMRLSNRLADQQVWLELLADAKAEKIADKFEELLKARTKDQTGKLLKDDLKELVHEAVIQSR